MQRIHYPALPSVLLVYILPTWLLLAFAAGCSPAAPAGLPVKGYAFVARGRMAYFALGSRIQAVDFSNPAAPARVGEIDTAIAHPLLLLAGERLYVINHGA